MKVTDSGVIASRLNQLAAALDAVPPVQMPTLIRKCPNWKLQLNATSNL
jgi:hypothetical protein